MVVYPSVQINRERERVKRKGEREIAKFYNVGMFPYTNIL